jgi:hypothetical protein
MGRRDGVAGRGMGGTVGRRAWRIWGDVVCSGRDAPGQLCRKGFWPKPENEKREASKFDWTIC